MPDRERPSETKSFPVGMAATLGVALPIFYLLLTPIANVRVCHYAQGPPSEIMEAIKVPWYWLEGIDALAPAMESYNKWCWDHFQ